MMMMLHLGRCYIGMKELIHKLFKDILLQQEMQYVKELDAIIAPLEKVAFRQQKIIKNYKG